MTKTIIKRDGRRASFNPNKIKTAISAAASDTKYCSANFSENEIGLLTDKVCEMLDQNFEKRSPNVEQIQDTVETVLMSSEHMELAKSFILFREERNKARDKQSALMKTIGGITEDDSSENDLKRENGNIDGDTAMGAMLKFGSETSKQYSLLSVIPGVFSDAHIRGDIHIHDLDFHNLTTTCCQIDLKKLFEDGGFCTGHGYLRTPQSISSYASLAAIAIQANQNDQHGGQSVPAFDYYMADGVKKTLIRELKDSIYISVTMAAAKIYDLIYGKLSQKMQKSPPLSSFLSSFEHSAHRGVYEAISPAFSSECISFADFGSREAFECSNIPDKFFGVLQHALTVVFDLDGTKAQSVIQKFYQTKEKKICLDFIRRNTYKKVKKATYQAMEAFVHNLNTMHSRAGAQVPFSSINYGTDTTPEGRLVIEQLLLATDAGLGNGETPIFPIQIFKVKDGVSANPEDPNYDLFKLACKVSAKRLFPNFSFIDAPFNKKFYKEGDYNTEISYMGCRTRVIENVHDRDNEVVTGRGNLSFTTINLPRLGIEHNGNIDKFFFELERKMDMVVEQLKFRFKIQANKRVKNFPFLMGQGVWLDSDKLTVSDKIESALMHGSLSIGFIGLAECLVALTGKHHGEDKESRKLGLEIIKFMRDYTDKVSQETAMNFTLLATPAEGLSGRFIKLDQKRYGTIEGVTDRDYYTNSFHVPVHYNISITDKISIEAPYHALTNAGHISYIEVDGDLSNNIDAFMSIINHMKKSGIGYGAINHPVDMDPVCGYIGIIGNECPRCGRKDGESVPTEKLERLKMLYPQIKI